MLISICIATYKRPEILRKLLNSIVELEGGFNLEIVVTDNDVQKSAEWIVEEFSGLNLNYYIQEVRGIAAARNRCLENANGDFVAFLDDDEYLTKEWLKRLMQELNEQKADCAFGPSQPRFLGSVPKWKKEFYKRKKLKAGTVLKNVRFVSTANCIMTKECARQRFDNTYGLTGGSDLHFFRALLDKGYKLIWCDEAVVYEQISKNRLTLKYLSNHMLKKGFVKARFILRYNKKPKAITKIFFLSVVEVGLGLIKSGYYLIVQPSFVILPLFRIIKTIGQLKALTKKDYLFYAIERKIK